MSFKRKLASVFIFVLLLYFVASNTIDAEQAADKTQAAPTREFGVRSGWAWGHLREQDDYEMVPLYAQIGFDAKPFFKKIHLQPSGNISFIVEPFINTIVSPNSNVETGTNFILKYRYPLTQKFHVFFEGGEGLLWTSQHTHEQSTQFNFNGQFGGGISYFFAKNKSFNVGYRFRHFSNASIKEPNHGVDLKFILVGISLYY